MDNNQKIGKLALGTVQFGLNYGISNNSGVTPNEEVQEILDLAYSEGITFIDTAFTYGKSEEVLGAFPLTRWNIISKFPKIEDKAGNVKSYFATTTARLGVKQLYGYIAHNAAAILETPQSWEELTKLKENGSVKKIGYSLYKPKDLEVLLQKGFTPDLIQIPYNFLDQRFKPYFKLLKEQGTEIHTRSSFLQGLFFMNSDQLSDYFSEIKPSIAMLQSSFSKRGDMVSFLLNFCLEQKEIDKVVIGVNDHYQLKENITSISNEVFSKTTPPKLSNEDILLPYNWPK